MFNFLRRKTKKELWFDLYEITTGQSILKIRLDVVKSYVNLCKGVYRPLEFPMNGLFQIVFYER